MEPTFIDTHTHLNLKRLTKDIDQHILNCESKNIIKLIVPGIDIPSSLVALQLADKYPNQIKSAVGIHPEEVLKPDFSLQLINQIELMLENPHVVAIGEVGLDYYYAKTTPQRRLQQELLIKQIKLAQKFNKTIIIHNRESSEDLIQIVKSIISSKFTNKIVFHCCESNLELLDLAIKHHIFIGVDGDITYDSNKQSFVRQVPLDLIVLETDSPFLLPEPLRSTKDYPNVPANLPLIAQAVAKIKKFSVEQIAHQTTQNAKLLFNLD